MVHLCITRLGLACCTYVRNRQQLFRHNGYMYHCVSPCDTSATYVYCLFVGFSFPIQVYDPYYVHSEVAQAKRTEDG